MAHMMAHGSIMPDHQPNPDLVKKIVQQLKINGLFDEMRRDCLADIDTKPAFQNLKQRVEGHVHAILARQQWSPLLNKNQLRSKIRESVMQSGILNEGVDRILYQVFSAKVHSVFLPKIEEFIQEKGDELKKEFLPPPIDVSNFAAPPVPVPPDMLPENFPPMPAQPPPPELPVVQTTNETKNNSENLTSDMSLAEDSVPETTEEIQNYDGEEFYVKDVAPEDVVVKAINTPSPDRSTPEASADEETPKIPQEAVNPLRSLIQSLLVSKNTILDSNDNIQEQHTEVVEETVREKAGYSPTIDPSEIEGFTDDEETDNQEQNHGPKTPVSLDACARHSNQGHSRSASPDHVEPYSPAVPQGDAYTPPSPYSPLSPSQIFTSEETSAVDNKNTDGVVSPDAKEYDTPLTPAMAYDPSKFSYQQMSDSTEYTEGTNAQSPPSPTSADVTDVTEKGRQTDDNYFFSEDARNDIDMRQNNTVTYRPPKAKKRRKPSTDSSGSSSGTITSSSSSESENEEIVYEQEVEQEVEEMVEEVEVVEEFTSESGEAQEDDEEEEEEEEVKSEKSVEIKSKKKKKKSKKRKTKKARKRTRSSSISSGEITSSGEISSDSSSDESARPTRPTGPPKQKTALDLEELEERRREMMREESMRDRPYWANTESSSDYLSSPGRMRHPYSPPRRPYSPEFRRFESGRAMEMGFGPHFRDRPVFHGRPMHPRFSPPYRRSPPRGYSPGPRMDYPRMPFGSPHSPPRRPYSPPPRMMGGFPDMRPPFDHPRHRWGSPPRRSSRSPPPGMRRDDGPGPSRF